MEARWNLPSYPSGLAIGCAGRCADASLLAGADDHAYMSCRFSHGGFGPGGASGAGDRDGVWRHAGLRASGRASGLAGTAQGFNYAPPSYEPLRHAGVAVRPMAPVHFNGAGAVARPVFRAPVVRAPVTMTVHAGGFAPAGGVWHR